MALIAGVDGAKGGWITVVQDTSSGELLSRSVLSIADLLAEFPSLKVVAVDIPIGLTDDCARSCDMLVRRMIRPRHSSVFPAPLRPAVTASSRAEADAISRSLCGKGVGEQSFAIYSKVREVDELLCSRPSLRSVVFEIHPELCFWGLNGEAPMAHSKRTLLGASERLALVEGCFPGAFALVRREHGRRVADDDILDALAALWTAGRILDGQAVCVPEAGSCDGVGLRMGMWW